MTYKPKSETKDGIVAKFTKGEIVIQGIKWMDKAKELEAKLAEYEQDWLPIDYGEAGTGKSCFTGNWVLARTKNGKIAIVRIILDGRDFFYWLGQFGESFDLEEMKDYRPIPKGWLKL